MGWDDDDGFEGLFSLLIYLRYLPQCTLLWCAVGCLLLQIYSKVIQVRLLLKGSQVVIGIPRLN